MTVCSGDEKSRAELRLALISLFNLMKIGSVLPTPIWVSCVYIVLLERALGVVPCTKAHIELNKPQRVLGDLIDAEQALSQADQSVIDLRTQHTLRFIELNVRLGAGHDPQGAP